MDKLNLWLLNFFEIQFIEMAVWFEADSLKSAEVEEDEEEAFAAADAADDELLLKSSFIMVKLHLEDWNNLQE